MPQSDQDRIESVPHGFIIGERGLLRMDGDGVLGPQPRCAVFAQLSTGNVGVVLEPGLPDVAEVMHELVESGKTYLKTQLTQKTLETFRADIEARLHRLFQERVIERVRRADEAIWERVG
jgi:hypothetical protein